jgi:hypothetical protein
VTVALFEPFAGIAGDMTVAALLDLGYPLETLRASLSGLPIDGWEISSARVTRGAFAGTHFTVRHGEDQPHRHLSDVRRIIEAGSLPDRVVARATDAFTRLAEAEATAHGTTKERVHFHEVGAIDAIIDIVGAALGLEHFGVEEVVTTEIRVGTGEIECAHGIIPSPAPGTMALLTGLPIRLAPGEGETTTPTGAALLAAWATPIRDGLPMVPAMTGYGAGTRDDTPVPNLLRVTIGDRTDDAGADQVVEIAANVDDQSAEQLAYAAERLLAAGALDVWITAVTMKKGRPGHVVTVLADPARVRDVESTLFAETTTFGVRRSRHGRTILARRHETVTTPWGEVRVKVGSQGGRDITRSPEHDDCARLAAAHGVALREVWREALRAATNPD